METEPIDPGGDDATKAFNEVRDRLAGLSRAVDSMAGEWKTLAIPDYTDTLAEIRDTTQALASHYRKLRDAPALSVTPDQLAAQINAASTEARKVERQSLQNAENSFATTNRELTGFIELARTATEQRRRLWQGVGGGALAGILLWSFLPGTIARAVPESWRWPERMAARMIGESSRWDAGTRLMQSESPEALGALEQAADLLRDNRQAIEACEKSAASERQPVRCTVRIRAGSAPRN